MKILDIIKEIGDGSGKIYPTTRDEDNSYYQQVTYTFKTDTGDKYEVKISKLVFKPDPGQWKAWDISFGIEKTTDWGGQFISYIDKVNRGEVFNIMATVVHSIKSEINISLERNEGVQTIEIIPVGMHTGDSKRANLYLAYFKKLVPNARVEINPADIIVHVNIMPPQKTIPSHKDSLNTL